jgi:aminopeptidase N
VALTALRETVRAGELDPARWMELLLILLASERDPEAHAWLLDAALEATLRYLTPSRGEPLRARLEALLVEQLRAQTKSLALQCLRTLLRCARSDEGLDLIDKAARTQKLPGDVALGAQDAYAAYGALLAAGRAGDVRENLPRSGDVARFVYLAEAAQPDVATKARYFKTYLDDKDPPEQWVQQSLGSFHWPGQEELTLPFLRQALARIEWVKAHRKIFFMPAWIDGFVNGHSSPEALAVVEAFLTDRPDLSDDVRRKILQSLDELRRAVRIRTAWQ